MSKRQGSTSNNTKYVRSVTAKKSKLDIPEDTTKQLEPTEQNAPTAGPYDTNRRSSHISLRPTHSRRPSFFCVGPNDWHGPHYVNKNTQSRTYCSQAGNKDSAVSVLVTDESNISNVAVDEAEKLRNGKDNRHLWSNLKK